MLVIIDVYSMIITNMCIISPSAPERILSCQLTSVKSTSTHQRGSSGGTYKEKESDPSALSQESLLPSCKIGRNLEGVAFSKPRNCPLEPFLQSNGALLILHPHNQKGPLKESSKNKTISWKMTCYLLN